MSGLKVFPLLTHKPDILRATEPEILFARYIEVYSSVAAQYGAR